MTLAHGIIARAYARFDEIVNALRRCEICSNVYIEIFDSKPRIAVAVGEKYFFRAGNFLAVTTVVVDQNGQVVVKAVATGGRKGFLDLFDLGSSRDYAREVIERVFRVVNARYEIVREVDYLSQEKSDQMKV